MAVVGFEFVRIGGEFRSVSVGSIRYRGALTLCVYIFESIQKSKINNSKFKIKREREREREYVWWSEGTSAEELKAWKELSVGTGIEPQRKPTGFELEFGRTTSSFPTH